MRTRKIDIMEKINEFERMIIELKRWKIGDTLSQDTEYKIGTINNASQRDFMIEILEGNINDQRNSAPEDNKLYLSEIIEIEKPTFRNNNLILAPVGSGKTTLIEEVLIKGRTGRIIMLVSNTTLKDATCPNDLAIRKKIGHRMFTSNNRNKYGDVDYDIHVMCYAEFGNKIMNNNNFVENSEVIFCDEIHSLPDYKLMSQASGGNDALVHTIKYLFSEHKNQQIFYFTATDEKLKELAIRQRGIFQDVSIFDYRNHKDIKKYMSLSEYKINNIEQIKPHLKARLESFNYFGYKGLAFSRTISGQKKIEQIVRKEGFNPLVLWSVNNKDNKLNIEQLEARTHLLNLGTIPEPYNFLIINAAMQEGWNLYDNKIKLAIMNTTNETEHIQALGRLRNDIDVLIYRTKDKGMQEDVILNIPKEYLDIYLTTSMKSDLCKSLNILNSRGDISRWNAIKILLKEKGYIIEDKTIKVDEKATRVSIIQSLQD